MTDDPGWAPALRLLSPFGLRPSPTPLVRMRLVYVTFVVALTLLVPVFLAVLDIGGDTGSGLSGLLVAGMLVGVSTALFAAMLVIRRSRLAAVTSENLAGTYMTAFFLSIALSESPAMLGFALSFSIGASWPYYLGLGLAVPGFLVLAPTARRIERLRDEILPGVDVVGLLHPEHTGGGATA